MDRPELTGRPSGDPADWRRRYRPFVASSRGEAVDDPTVTAVVVAWDGSDQLQECLTSLRRAGRRLDGPLEIIVVDNDAPPRLRRITDEWDRWIRLTTNLGPAPARNLGAALAGGPLVAFVDDDGLAAPDYFDGALAYFDDEQVIGLRGRVVARDHPLFCAAAGHYDRGPQPCRDALITEGASLVRRTAFVEAGGFADDLYGHEGIDLTRRLESLADDAHTLYAPDVVLRHDYATSWTEFAEKHLRCAVNERSAPHADGEAAEYIREYHRRSFGESRRSLPEFLSRIALDTIGILLRQIGQLGFRVKNLVSGSRGNR